MGTKNQRRAAGTRETMLHEVGEFFTSSEDLGSCPHGHADEYYNRCLVCELNREGLDWYHDVRERANRQAILDLVQRFGDDPTEDVRAVMRDGHDFVLIVISVKKLDTVTKGYDQI